MLGHNDRRGLELQELTTAMVRGPDTLVSTIENSLTPAERNMIALDEHQRVREIRTFFQHAGDREFIEKVEQITGRKVRAFVSGIDTAQDVSSEVFYLEPVSAP